MRLVDVIKRPVVTEKVSLASRGGQVVVFEVARGATKKEVVGALKELFGVQALRVRTAVMPGKKKRQGSSVVIKSAWKKAVITLREGQQLNLHEEL